MPIHSRAALRVAAVSIPAFAVLSFAGCSSEQSGANATGIGTETAMAMGGMTLGMGGSGNASNAGGAAAAAAAPGSSGAAPGASGATPGASGATPGASGAAPGASGASPGSSGAASGSAGAAAGAGGAGLGAGGAGGGSPNTGGSTAAGECVLPELPDAEDLPDLGVKLPDPFTFFDGTPVTTKAQWECRRKEILAMAAKYLYGPIPGDCDEVSGSVDGEDVSITCTVGGQSEDFSATISGSGDAINLNLASGILPNGKSLSLGSGNESKIQSLYDLSELNPNIANAWMVNRVMDVLEQNPGGGHDPTKMAVSGCSGCGKGAFFVGVFSRIPLTVIVESGGGGGTSWRMTEWFTHGDGQSRWNCGDRPQGIDVLEDSGICGPWVTSAARSFRDNPETVNNMPFDQHLLLATIAPRYLVHFTNDQNQWCWLAGTSEALASWAAHSVYSALGVPENHSFEIYGGGHCGVGDTGIAAAMFDRAIDGDMSADTGHINIQDSRVMIPVSEWEELFIDWDMDTILE